MSWAPSGFSDDGAVHYGGDEPFAAAEVMKYGGVRYADHVGQLLQTNAVGAVLAQHRLGCVEDLAARVVRGSADALGFFLGGH